MSKLVKKVIGGSRAAPEPAPVEKPEPLIPDHERLQLEARKRAARRRGGRASTILSEDRLG